MDKYTDYQVETVLEMQPVQIIPFIQLPAVEVYTPYYLVLQNGYGIVTVKENKYD